MPGVKAREPPGGVLQHPAAELAGPVPGREFLGLLERRREQHAGLVRLPVFGRPLGGGADHARAAPSAQPEAVAGALAVCAASEGETAVGALSADDLR